MAAVPQEVKDFVQQALAQERTTLEARVAKYLKDELSKMNETLSTTIAQATAAVGTALNETKELKELADLLMEKRKLALFLIGQENGRCMLMARISPDLIGLKIHANDWLKAIAPLVDGKGGGKADAAQGGGTAIDKIPEAMQQAEEWILSQKG